MLDESSDRLARAQRLAQQNEEIGVAILDELGDQRETLKRAYDKVPSNPTQPNPRLGLPRARCMDSTRARVLFCGARQPGI